jgi:hypothetical protein
VADRVFRRDRHSADRIYNSADRFVFLSHSPYLPPQPNL